MVMNKMKALLLGAATTGLALASHAAADVSSLETEITGTATAIASSVGVVAVAGLGVYGIIWGVRKLKSAISSGS